MKPTIYIAGSSSEIERAKSAITLAKRAGFAVLLDWTEVIENAGGPNAAAGEAARVVALQDLRAAVDADVLWVLLSADHVSGGAHAELGARLVMRPDHTIVSGASHRETVFYSLCQRFDTDAQALLELVRIAEAHPKRGVA